MDHNCCLCKPYCDDNGLGSSSEPGTEYSPLPESSSATCGTFEYDTDYSGGDIIPVTSELQTGRDCTSCGLTDCTHLWGPVPTTGSKVQ